MNGRRFFRTKMEAVYEFTINPNTVLDGGDYIWAYRHENGDKIRMNPEELENKIKEWVELELMVKQLKKAGILNKTS